MKKPSSKPGKTGAGKEKSISGLSFSEAQFQQFLEALPDPVLVTGADDQLIYLNGAARDFLGCEGEVPADKKITDIVCGEDFWPRPGERRDCEFFRFDGSAVWGEVFWQVLPDERRLVFVHDITGRKRAEQALLDSQARRWQSQKIEALGLLAGGVAHDFNNFLAVILLHIDMLNLQIAANSPLRHRVDEIKEVTKNAAGMVRQLLAIGRKQTLRLQPVMLNPVIKEFSKTLPALLGENIEVQFAPGADLGVCFVDPQQLVQILRNLSVNARTAMPEGGVLRIETANIVLDEQIAGHKFQPNGSYIQIKIADNGTGMDAKTAECIFEPFFTTKESGKGAGLGLATVYGTIKQSKGFIWVESKIKQGTVFTIQFPRIDQPVEPVRKVEQKVSKTAGVETVLLVEDEELVRRLTSEILKDLGYRVLEAADGTEALRLAASHQEPIHLLLTDFSMTPLNGREIAAQITALHPETKVILMSGALAETISGEGSSGQKHNFLAKPFSPADLAAQVRTVLESE